MDDEIKVSELPQASQVNAADLLMIIQGGANKKITNQAFQNQNTTRLDTAEEKIENLENSVAAIQKVMTIGLSAEVDLTAAGKIPFNKVLFDNTNGLLTLNNNGIKIGAGVQQVIVSGQCFAQRNDSAAPYIWTRVDQNNDSINFSISSTATDYGSTAHTDTPREVQENDLFTMYKIVASNMKIRPDGNTILTVKIIK